MSQAAEGAGQGDVGLELVAPPSESDSLARLPFALMLGLFVVSGATGLVDQLCFSKYLGYVVGATAYAVSAVLAAFMTGLGLGAWLGGRWSARVQRPLFGYGALELVVALTVAATPLGFRWLTPLYAELLRAAPNSLLLVSVVRWCAALLLVVLPTLAMGATLPLLSRAIDAMEAGTAARERRLAALYAANTFGGAAGALLAAYLILPALGVKGTLWASAGLSAAIGVTALWRGRGLAVAAASSALAPDGAVPASLVQLGLRERAQLALLAFASGALVFGAEVLFTHLLALIIGSSVYAFGLILTAFLLALFLGAALSRLLRAWLGESAIALGLAATALALLGSLSVWDQLPLLLAASGKTFTTFAMREAVRGAIAIGVLLLPTALMGLTFPLLLQRVARYAGMGGWVGTLTTINTIGSVLGALGMGYWLLPWLGSQRALIALGLCFAGLTPLAAAENGRTNRYVAIAFASVASVLGLLARPWDLVALTNGANVYFDGQPPTQRLVSLREDIHGGVTSVTENEGAYTLFTNGKFQGNTGWEMNAQRFFAHYPCLFVQQFASALVIGLGTGTTLGTLATYPWQHLRVVEISPAIVSAARRYFRGPNRGAIDDPRVELVHADGRNQLLVSDARYDLISMELSSIWFAGAASLYSDEFYRLVASRLQPGGVFQQWVQLHHVYREDFATVVHTLRQNFAHVALFYGGNQGILVASQAPLHTTRAHLDELQRNPALVEVLPYGRALSTLFDDVLLMDADLDSFLGDAAKKVGRPVSELISTDENLYLEYATPRGNVLPWTAREALVAELKGFRHEAAIAAMLSP